jgi:hypothetical protein
MDAIKKVTGSSVTERPLFVEKTPAAIHEWLEDLKQETDISKADIVKIILMFAMRYLDKEDIDSLYNSFLVLGETGLSIELLVEGNEIRRVSCDEKDSG